MQPYTVTLVDLDRRPCVVTINYLDIGKSFVDKRDTDGGDTVG